MRKPLQFKTLGEGSQFTAELTKQQVTQDNNTGFLFCPRCGFVVINENPAGICCKCGYRFCPSCSD